MRQAQAATQAALADGARLVEVEFPTASLIAVAGDAEGGLWGCGAGVGKEGNGVGQLRFMSGGCGVPGQRDEDGLVAVASHLRW